MKRQQTVRDEETTKSKRQRDNKHLRDQETAAKCEGKCELEYVNCTLSCSDTNCLIECGRALTNCVQG